MAKKISLREFQQSLSQKLQSVSQGTGQAAQLGVQAGSVYWLVNLSDTGEIVPVPELTPVPLTHPWFSGIANIRGNLFSVVDFSAFQGEEPTQLNVDSRLLLVGQKFSVNFALLITRTLGLKNVQHFKIRESATSAKPWIGALYVDDEGNEWKTLYIQGLIEHPNFLQVGT